MPPPNGARVKSSISTGHRLPHTALLTQQGATTEPVRDLQLVQRAHHRRRQPPRAAPEVLRFRAGVPRQLAVVGAAEAAVAVSHCCRHVRRVLEASEVIAQQENDAERGEAREKSGDVLGSLMVGAREYERTQGGFAPLLHVYSQSA